MHEVVYQTNPWRSRIALVLVMCWLILTAYAFWWFHFRHLYAVTSIEQWVMFSSDELTYHDSTDHGIPILIHFHDPDCPCSRFVVPDVKDILEKFSGQIEVRVIVPNAHALEEAKRVFGVSAEVLSDQITLAASPAAWLMNADGQTAYLGPYSDSGICTTSNSHQVATIITDLLDGHTLVASNHLTTGCFCSWPNLANAL